MIVGTFHRGSGLGNQLFRYVMVRTLAMDKGLDWGMQNSDNFKGASFMKLKMYSNHSPVTWNGTPQFEEKKVVENGVDIRGYDPEINFVEEGIIDGEFQDQRYWGHRLPEMKEWLKVETLDVPDDLCVINFRGGEFTAFPDLFLPKDYWDKAIEMMRAKYPNIRFEVHTDDPATARQFFPDFMVWDNQMITDDKQYANIGFNWRSVRYAKHLIIANSSFPILPALLNEEVKEIIAPRYWARRNTKQWALPQNYYPKFQYI